MRVAVLYPELLGTYGDGGNATVLVERLRRRGMAAERLEVHGGQALPASCDVYLLGGGEDGPQRQVATLLAAGGRLAGAVDAGAVVLAVCAGMQVLGHDFHADGRQNPGLGLLPLRTGPAPQGVSRAVGEMVLRAGAAAGGGLLVGFENHAGRSLLDDGAAPLGEVLAGIGNGDPRGGTVDGAVAGRVLGTYLHGPVLALNPALADLMLGWVVGELDPLPDDELDVAAQATRANRLRLAGLADGLARS